tara:strand:+ start:7879 stop:8448 length:570 start_codon:yes stop_codon:yes gene_type:complete
MYIFIRTNTNETIPITVLADWKVGDICRQLLPEYTDAILSFQGRELRDLDQPLSDTGIGSESILDVRNSIRPILYMIKDSRRGKRQLLLDFENSVIYSIFSPNTHFVTKLKLTKIGDNQYENEDMQVRNVYTIIDDKLTMEHYINDELCWNKLYFTNSDINLPIWDICNNENQGLIDEIIKLKVSYKFI